MRTIKAVLKRIRPANIVNFADAKLWKVRGKWEKNFGIGREADQILQATSLFFILGSGRSGTYWLSNLLNQNKNTVVFHEPDFSADCEVMSMASQHPEGSATLEYNHQFRKYRIARRIKQNSADIYGEVTGTLRHHCFALKTVFPKAEFMMLCRDGRDVIRSVMPWAHYTKGSTGAYNIEPVKGQRYFEQWKSMSRFEKMCWEWDHSYRILLACIPPHRIVHFERMTSEYDYFLGKIVNVVGILVKQEKWGIQFNTKEKNATQYFTYPHWKDWAVQEKNAFDRICGETMNRLGYDYQW